MTNTGSQVIKSAEFNIVETMNIKIPSASNGSVKMAIEIPAGATSEFRLTFDVKNISVKQQLKGSLVYRVSWFGCELALYVYTTQFSNSTHK